MEARIQKELEAQKERETEAQEQTKFEAQEQNDRDQQMLKEPEEQTKYHEPMENENEREREREEQELKAGRQEGEEPLSFGLRRHAWNVAHVKAASLRRKGKPSHIFALFQEQLAEIIVRRRTGNKKCERRAKLREQRKIKWAEDTPEDSLEESPKDSSPATAQEETTTASGTPREEEIVAVSVPTQEQAELVEAREPAKSDSSAHNESSPAVRKSIKQIETELIQEHQHAWATAGTGRSEFQSVRRPLNIVRTQRRMLAASIEKLKDKDISTPSEEDNSYQSEVHALSATESEQATAPSSAVSEVVVGVAMRADMMHEERANHQS
ncbi:hypothetical protein GMOD_00002862 [Pyrenophora seminiperda CCB06]|uniref:Uncharacterized protein n=1 Tax=Pyrenophora seminiperda CCB06 TaxID=1302712 RepID=A0A3M7M367_9PLEO|nr:hypothetical protein GMOD_00002862 [Pyrenophora seminiperda CCB06]